MRALGTAPVVVLALLGASAAFAQPASKDAQGLPSLAPLVESVKAAVVNVDVQARSPRGEDLGGDVLEHFFGRRPQRDRLRQGSGSGFIIDPRGLVLTNNHVVESAVTIRVRLDDGRSFEGQVLGRDPLTDVALLKLKGKVENLPVVHLGDSTAMRVGDWVVAIGNPFGLASSVSVGIISARARQIRIAGPYDDFLQTDAAINPGNSGGPLFNMRGEVIGINTAIVGGGSGIGFAVPSNLAKALLPMLEKDGAVTRGWLGIGIQDLTADLGRAMGLPVQEGAVVTQVNEGSPAARGGLKADDVIIAIDGEKVNSGGALTRTVALKRPGSTVTVQLYREGRPMELKVQLGTRPDLENVGSVAPERGKDEGRRQRLGLSFTDMDPRLAEGSGLPTQGALVTEVNPGSPAERAELAQGMVIVEASGRPVRRADDLLRALNAAPSGRSLLLRVYQPGAGGRGLRAITIP